jgi:hypothetical protein
MCCLFHLNMLCMYRTLRLADHLPREVLPIVCVSLCVLSSATITLLTYNETGRDVRVKALCSSKLCVSLSTILLPNCTHIKECFYEPLHFFDISSVLCFLSCFNSKLKIRCVKWVPGLFPGEKSVETWL